ncbi:hypothetical protein F5876DRAFT_66278 [Lentinula aff. lateritia]|uniref:Uncharacterized protein n=1 Tax=Lentinula aff. lateritia TaxID=2804960 RepID=A0ACC1TY07_9AGAR|nr:hypothetical protein F5876DRAFT_66278 [Lentinula aff. lateritia]
MASKSTQSLQVSDNDPTSSANTSQELIGYGDISQSEINFLPSLPSEIVIERPPSYRRNAKRPLPPTIGKNITTESKEFDGLSALLDNLRTERENMMSQGREPSQSSVKAGIEQPKFTARRIPAPLQINNFNGAHRVSGNLPSRVSPPRPFRGNAPLPRRSPLPRWDLLDPDVYLEGKQYKIRFSHMDMGVFYNNTQDEGHKMKATLQHITQHHPSVAAIILS